MSVTLKLADEDAKILADIMTADMVVCECTRTDTVNPVCAMHARMRFDKCRYDGCRPKAPATHYIRVRSDRMVVPLCEAHVQHYLNFPAVYEEGGELP